MSIAEEFAALIAERPNLSIFIDRIEATHHGCKYLFDGYMPCHVVFYAGRYRDVQDREHPLEDILRFTAYDSVLSLVLNMEETLSP